MPGVQQGLRLRCARMIRKLLNESVPHGRCPGQHRNFAVTRQNLDRPSWRRHRALLSPRRLDVLGGSYTVLPPPPPPRPGGRGGGGWRPPPPPPTKIRREPP